ncbi:MAG: galactonate dehydratase [Paracoccaceae bacterium]|jgi:galactonate dehydratase
MRLKNLEVFIVAPPAPGWGGRYWIFPKLTTDTGLMGYGECYASSVSPQVMVAVIEDVFSRHMQGENPENIELMFRRAYSAGFTQRPDLTVMGAFSGLEIACWDILGKARNRPVWALLGGKMNARIRSYTYIYPTPGEETPDFWFDVEATAKSAKRFSDMGFTALKFDPAGPYTIRGGHEPSMSDISRSVAFCAAIREAVGDRADLLFGTHGQFSSPGAIRMGKAIEPFNPLWYEEPCPPDNLLEFAAIAAHVNVPLAAGERLSTKAEFGMLLRAGGVKILQPALGRVGGIHEAKKIAALAEIFNAQIAPHLYAGPVEWAANIHLAASIPNLLMVETIEAGGTFHQRLIKNTIKWEDGYIIPPETPGLGIEFDEDLACAHPYFGKALHLEMQEAPCDYSHGNKFQGGAPSL